MKNPSRQSFAASIYLGKSPAIIIGEFSCDGPAYRSGPLSYFRYLSLEYVTEATGVGGDEWTLSSLIADVNGASGARLVSELGSSVRFARVDVTDEMSVRHGLEQASELGTLRGVLNAAGIVLAEKVLGKNGPHGLDARQFRAVMAFVDVCDRRTPKSFAPLVSTQVYNRGMCQHHPCWSRDCSGVINNWFKNKSPRSSRSRRG